MEGRLRDTRGKAPGESRAFFLFVSLVRGVQVMRAAFFPGGDGIERRCVLNPATAAAA